MGMESRYGETENEVQSVTLWPTLDGAYGKEKVGSHQESHSDIPSSELSKYRIQFWNEDHFHTCK